MNAKKIIVVVGGAVLVYTLIVYPVQLGNGAQTVFGWVKSGIESAVTFMRTTFS